MILIADSGSTKTEWVLIDGKKRETFFTMGLNPFFADEEFVAEELQKNFPQEADKDKVKRVYFYGAGCSSEERCSVIRNGLSKVFTKAELFVHHDILGAAAGLFGDGEGIAIILGTGSNSCVYDGKDIVANIPALGYILGDEGSGAFFGLQLVKDFLNKEMPAALMKSFEEEYSLTREYILDRVYKKPFPNRFLASFAPFLSRNISNEYITGLITNGFDLFFRRHVLPYDNYASYKLGSVGSVGYFLSPLLKEVAKKYGFGDIKILKSPMEGLIDYFANKE